MSVPTKNIVYLLYDASGALLYVGSSSRGERRIHEHAAFAGWWNEVATYDIEYFEHVGAARIREGDLIRSTNPKYNIQRGPQPMHKTTLDLPHDLYIRLREYAREDGRHMKSVIVEAVEALLTEDARLNVVPKATEPDGTP